MKSDMNSKSIISKKQKIMTIFFSFLLPVVIVGFAYFSIGIYAGGKFTNLTFDLKSQYISFFSAPRFFDSFTGFSSFEYAVSGGMQGGYFGTMAYYDLSPLCLVLALVPINYLPDAVYFITLISIGLCGVAFSIYCFKGSRYELKSYDVVVLSTCYALMSYNIGYSMCIMWISCVIMLPIVILGVEYVIERKGIALLVCSLSLCIICNYYISFMVALFVTLYGVFYAFNFMTFSKANLLPFFKTIIKLAFSGLISAMISAFVIIPVYLDFGRGKSLEPTSSNSLLVYRNFFDVIKMLKPLSFSTLKNDGAPFIFCGSLILLLSILFFASINIRFKLKISSLVVVLIYFISFCVGDADRIWHGFRDPNCFPARYSFTFSFFILTLAALCITYFRKCDLKTVGNKNIRNIYKFVSGITNRRLFKIGVILLVLGELYFNSSYIFKMLESDYRYSPKAEYDRFVDYTSDIITKTDDFGRVINERPFSLQDGQLYGYSGVSSFSSSYNLIFNDFLGLLGVGQSYHTVRDKGFTPFTASMLGVKYIITYSEEYDPYEFSYGNGMLKLFENPSSFPVSFSVFDIDVTTPDERRPFALQNTIANCLYPDAGDIFAEFNAAESFDNRGNSYNIDAYTSVNYVLEVPQDGNLWMYVPFTYNRDDEDVILFHDGKMGDKSGYGDTFGYFNKIYVNGVEYGDFQDDILSYCVDLGKYCDGDRLIITLESFGKIADPQFAMFDEYSYNLLADKVRDENIIKDLSIKRGVLTFKADFKNDGFKILALPFEKGYKLYVDGKPTDILSFDDALLLYECDSGSHIIELEYHTPGLNAGITISLITFFVCIMFLLFFRIKRKEKNSLSGS